MLKAVLFDFNGIIIKDESIHQELINEILIKENLRPSDSEYWEICLGKSDRACLTEILSRRGRTVSEDYLNKLIHSKTQAYQQRITELELLPIYPGVKDLMEKIQIEGLSIGVVTGALRSEVKLVLERAGLVKYLSTMIAGDDLKASKPNPDGYLLAVERLNRQHPYLQLQPSNCLAIEDTYTGIKAAKQAGMQVVGVANTYPLHMLQRQANWAVDYLLELELERIKQVFRQTQQQR
jgi:beta-phosphoglucomutase